MVGFASSCCSGGSNSARTSLEPGACSLLHSNSSKQNPLSSARGLSAQRSLEHPPSDLRVEGGSQTTSPKASALSRESKPSLGPKPSNGSSTSNLASSSGAPKSTNPVQRTNTKTSVGKPPLQKCSAPAPLESHFEKIDISANDVEDEAAAARPYMLNPNLSTQQKARMPAHWKGALFSNGRASG